MKRVVATVGSMAAAVWVTAFLALTAHAGSNESVVGWLGVDANADWVTVEVRKPGRGINTSRLKVETKATFKIQLDGTKPQATTVLIDGEAGELAAIPEGENVHVVWRPIEASEYGMYATKIVYLSEAETEARKKQDAEDKAAAASQE